MKALPKFRTGVPSKAGELSVLEHHKARQEKYCLVQEDLGDEVITNSSARSTYLGRVSLTQEYYKHWDTDMYAIQFFCLPKEN